MNDPRHHHPHPESGPHAPTGLEASRFGRTFSMLILDKIVLGIVLAITGYFLIAQIQHQDVAAEYRKVVFTRRMDAFIALLGAAREARDEYALVFAPIDSASGSSGPFVWERRFIAMRQRLEALRGAGSRTEGEGLAWDAYTSSDALTVLKKVDVIRRTNAVYFSKDVEEAVDGFLAAMLEALDASLPPAAGSAVDPSAAATAVRRAQEAYDALRQKILAKMPYRDLVQG